MIPTRPLAWRVGEGLGAGGAESVTVEREGPVGAARLDAVADERRHRHAAVLDLRVADPPIPATHHTHAREIRGCMRGAQHASGAQKAIEARAHVKSLPFSQKLAVASPKGSQYPMAGFSCSASSIASGRTASIRTPRDRAAAVTSFGNKARKPLTTPTHRRTAFATIYARYVTSRVQEMKARGTSLDTTGALKSGQAPGTAGCPLSRTHEACRAPR